MACEPGPYCELCLRLELCASDMSDPEGAGGRKSLEQLLEVTEQQPHWVRWKTNLPAPDNLSPGSHSSVQPCTEVKVTGQNQEQFLLLAKSAKGAALATLIHQVLEAPGVYVIGELLDMPNVRELAESDFASTFRLLTVFACGTYTDYLAEARNLPPLTEAHLSVVTLAAKVKCIPYAVLLEALALLNVQQLEDLVIEAVYADVLRGSLDQRNQRLEVDYSIGPDIQRQDLSAIAQTLQEWCVGCEVVLSGIEEQVSRANQHKEQQLGLKQQIESEVANLKKTIKVTTAASAAATSQDPEQHLTELRNPAPGTNQRQPSKKASKGKGLGGSAKIWSKSN
ncbi:COP9 signalosome complex subunit 7a-like [Marmota monax]|uniref:COP9 signalosome complex subunit 7a-like n=1 Tax=Marmota monax TaxID=9995 RepID=UPI001EAFE8CF|nr:COP9 signalosome complex subunit 7a-like [Marmota monax]